MANDYDPMDEPDIRAVADAWTPPLDFTGMVQHSVGFGGVMLAARLLWPPFVEMDGCVLLPWLSGEAGLAAWSEELAGDHGQIETMLNHLHLWDLFPGAPEDGLVALGETLVQTWMAALSAQFPGREFEVWLRNDEYDYGPTVYLRSRQRQA